ncbi:MULTISPECIES: molybdopterin synthase sulfur carrier subunit [Edwardsiella]|uniref:Molybdopterin synthase sulfur carrier subunit n=2 Tax=Edwardsiella anguillarum TaxID=1821960 RepID=A0A076LFB3_9GAMM|nr:MULTISPECIES: molybdopterin synthase sulfur carrier subunit [Edwardsiella]AKM47381.1 molybdopterin synthase small subunit [Edwardsiella sp. EA181011]GAJ66052.1 molybdopterin converting factor, subunit 1 [Edwardsiella piscicida]AIJ06846.1 Molybdenum cofactor biosynthesis protein MoaD [Edwardsiella anguillarum ET080813]AKR78297.1 molybdopterin synthase sulfur carrier subunit [Edwardsiella sp. LADL05-105]KAB0593439.1 molybdopterin synthase sulfur carrier subunit [Edwardsiella anguillarum]
MIQVRFFAQVRELTGCAELACESCRDVETLRAALAQRGDKWALALEPGKLLVAVNQTMAPFDHPLQEGDEVAFFPPVTGG